MTRRSVDMMQSKSSSFRFWSFQSATRRPSACPSSIQR